VSGLLDLMEHNTENDRPDSIVFEPPSRRPITAVARWSA